MAQYSLFSNIENNDIRIYSAAYSFSSKYFTQLLSSSLERKIVKKNERGRECISLVLLFKILKIDSRSIVKLMSLKDFFFSINFISTFSYAFKSFGERKRERENPD